MARERVRWQETSGDSNEVGIVLLWKYEIIVHFVTWPTALFITIELKIYLITSILFNSFTLGGVNKPHIVISFHCNIQNGRVAVEGYNFWLKTLKTETKKNTAMQWTYFSIWFSIWAGLQPDSKCNVEIVIGGCGEAGVCTLVSSILYSLARLTTLSFSSPSLHTVSAQCSLFSRTHTNNHNHGEGP